jgi:hypothetical protein
MTAATAAQLVSHRAYYVRNKAKVLAQQRIWRTRQDPILIAEKNRAWRAANQDKVQAQHHKRRGHPAPLRPKPETCEVCGQPPGFHPLGLEHDHITGAFRGWLCSNCNTAIGLVKESPTLLRDLALYLEGKLL